MRYFSKSTKTAYPGEDLDVYRNAGTLPADLVEIEDAAWMALLAAENAGKVIDADANGYPVAIDPIPETQAQVLNRAVAQIRTQRQPILDALTGIAGRAARAGDNATATAADQAADALLNITALPALLAATTYDEMKAAVLAEYRAIAAPTPATVQNAFREVLGL